MHRPPDKEKPALAARVFQKNDRSGRTIAQTFSEPSRNNQASTFARAVTRAEFGRHYWNQELDAEMRRQLRRSKARHPVRLLKGGAL